MTELNTIFDQQKRIVGRFRFGVAWRSDPRERLGEYDEGDVGRLYDNDGNVVGTFCSSTVLGLDGSIVGRFVEVPFSEFSAGSPRGIELGPIKRIEVGGQTAGWCIGNHGAACAAVFWLAHGELRA